MPKRKRKSRSKKKQSDNNSNWLNILRWFGVLAVVSILIGLIGFWIRLQQGSVWDMQRRMTFGVVSQSSPETIYVASIEPGVNAEVVEIPEEVKLQVTHGYGEYMSGSLYGLAEQENNMDIFIKTLEYELGIPFDGWIVKQQPLVDFHLDEDNYRYALKLFIQSLWLGDVQSNIAWGDRVKLWWQGRNMRYDQFQSILFSAGNWAREEQEIDGQEVIWFDKNSIDLKLPDLMADSQVRNSGLEVIVINTTNIKGLGSQISRVLTGLGSKVVHVSDSEEQLGQCVIRYSAGVSDSYSGDRIRNIFNCQTDNELLEDGRADVEIKLGLEQGRVWKGDVSK